MTIWGITVTEPRVLVRRSAPGRVPKAPPAPSAPRRRLPAPGLVALGICLLVLVGHGLNLAGWPAYFDDEGTYTAQAIATWSGDLAPYTYWYDHPPAGWLQLAGLLWLPGLLLPGQSEVLAARTVMVGVSVVTALLLLVAGRRLGLPLALAAVAPVLWAMSPLTVNFGRQVLLDNIAAAWCVGALVLLCDPRRRLSAVAAAGAAMGVAVLTKETVLLMAPALLVLLWTRSSPRARPFALTAFLGALAAVGSTYLVFAVLKGELVPGPDRVSLVGAVQFQLLDRRGSGAIWRAGDQANDVLRIWLGLDPVLLVAGLACACLLLFTSLRWVAAIPLSGVLVALRPDGFLPLMYPAAMLPFLALCVGLVAGLCWFRFCSSERSLGPEVEGLAVVSRRRPRFRHGVAIVVSAVLVIGLAVVWRPGLAAAWQDRSNDGHDWAMEWVRLNTAPDDKIVMDNMQMRTDAVAAGRAPDDVIYMWKLDRDPAATEDFAPGGLDQVDWVVSTELFESMEGEGGRLTLGLLREAVPVATFDADDGPLVTVYRVGPVVDGAADSLVRSRAVP